MTPSVCPACGAALAPDAEQCDLCGTMLEAAPPAGAPEPESALAEATQPPPAVPPPAAGPVTCAVCGHLNPAGSRFCNQCGATLAAPRAAAPAPPPAPAAPGEERPAPPPPSASPAPPTQAPEGTRPPSDPGRRALLVVGAGVLVVLGLYFVSQRSQRAEPPADASAGAAEQPRLTAAPVALPDSLEERVAALEDEGTARSLDDAGGLLYRAAAAQPPDDPQRGALAQRAVDLYERSLALDDDPDVRVNLAVAALLDPRNPMRAVQELQAVLTGHPDHVEANFNMGLMRMQIGRLDAAAESFRRVIALTPPDAPVHQRAAEALAAVEGAMAQQGTTG